MDVSTVPVESSFSFVTIGKTTVVIIVRRLQLGTRAGAFVGLAFARNACAAVIFAAQVAGDAKIRRLRRARRGRLQPVPHSVRASQAELPQAELAHITVSLAESCWRL
ncbi:MAG TPA: hypothetical protein V6C72_14630 [Chroococcales cyanobacterium]